MAVLHILWDASHIWGLLAVRAARALDIPYRLIRGVDIAGGLFQLERPSLLFVPGGNARHKAESLGRAGLGAIRSYVTEGGNYLGFCGGAGLALIWKGEPAGLGLCPWKRAGFDERLQHFMSGHLHMALASGGGTDLVPAGLPDQPRLPVWWPGRFAAASGDGVQVLASYERPSDDFWLADLPVADLPEDIFAAWKEQYGLAFTPAFLAGQPCIIQGSYGAGRYILSYSHLETPDSPHANLWFAHLLRVLGGLAPAGNTLPPWLPDSKEPLWADPDMDRLHSLFEEVRNTGLKHRQLFSRTDWLMGWRTGIPGANLNNIWATLNLIRSLPPSEKAHRHWTAVRERLLEAAGLFARACVQYLLAERLSMTLSKFLPSAVPPAMLKEQRESLFGPPMRADGLYRTIIEPLDDLAYLQLS